MSHHGLSSLWRSQSVIRLWVWAWLVAVGAGLVSSTSEFHVQKGSTSCMDVGKLGHVLLSECWGIIDRGQTLVQV